jgi:hexosaminidase
MKSIVAIVLAAAGVAGAVPPSVIPRPVSIASTAGTFEFSAATGILHAPALAGEAALLADDLARLTGSRPKVAAGRQPMPSRILLDFGDLPPSGYQLEVAAGGVTIRGGDPAGVFYGTRTLLQLLPPARRDGPELDGPVALPGVRISDHPRFGWRGMMLDVGRHFHPVPDIKRFIDWLAYHKINVFHWHLTDDQGWRIEIRKYPKLTEVGAWRASSPPYGNRNGDDGRRYGGFYTQEQVREIVAYAAVRHITVVPEIEMPGHAAAAITAYPELGNSDIPGYAPQVMTRWGVHPYVFAPKEETFRFLEDVLTEVCELFPSQYIHIGGDEAPKTQWQQSKFAQEVMKREHLRNEEELQSWFIRRIAKFLDSKMRRLIGWDEIQEGGLPKTATMMVWRDAKWAKHALDQGNNIVMATTSHTYFDYYQHPAAGELAKGVEYEAIGGMLPIEQVYSYDPASVASSEAQKRQILGTQAQLWSEYFKDFSKVEYHAFPRIAALAEVAWSPLEGKDYADFRRRLDTLLKAYDAAGLKRGDAWRPPVRKARDGGAVETSLGIYQNHWPELAFDGHADTFFWADRTLREGDHLTLRFKAPLGRAAKVTVKTGGPASRNGDKLENGVLEGSSNGSSWTKLADFSDGVAVAQAAAGTRHLRVRVTKPQENWLIVHEILVE